MCVFIGYLVLLRLCLRSGGFWFSVSLSLDCEEEVLCFTFAKMLMSALRKSRSEMFIPRVFQPLISAYSLNMSLVR
jgi:hypothetical protein